MTTPARDAQNIAPSLREYLESRLDALDRIGGERDKQYDARFRAAEIAVNAALAAQEKAVAAAFLASEKAIVKAEVAQADYNVRSNEFRGQLDDQAKTLMPRAETTVLFKSVDDKLVSAVVSLEGKLDALRSQMDKADKANADDIKSLRESRSEQVGSKANARDSWGYVVGAAGIVFGIIGVAIALLH